MTLAVVIARNAAFAPDKTAIVFEEERLSYAEFAARIERAATALKGELGVGRGDRVAILSPAPVVTEQRMIWGDIDGSLPDDFDAPLPDDLQAMFEGD